MSALSPWHIALVAIIILILFGSTKLPTFARSIGRSMRIFKSEMKEFRGNDDDDEAEPDQAKPRELPENASRAETAKPQPAHAEAGREDQGAEQR